MARLPARQRLFRRCAPLPGSMNVTACVCPRRGKGRACGEACEARVSGTLCDGRNHSCTNQLPVLPLARRVFAHKLGYGLRTTKMVRKGAFLCQYRGRHVTAVSPRALCTQKVVRLGAGSFLVADANDHGVAQYANHSCQPCAELKVLTSPAGSEVAVIVALVDLAPKRYVTINYGWTAKEWAKTTEGGCLCGESKCVSKTK